MTCFLTFVLSASEWVPFCDALSNVLKQFARSGGVGNDVRVFSICCDKEMHLNCKTIGHNPTTQPASDPNLLVLQRECRRNPVQWDLN